MVARYFSTFSMYPQITLVTILWSYTRQKYMYESFSFISQSSWRQVHRAQKKPCNIVLTYPLVCICRSPAWCSLIQLSSLSSQIYLLLEFALLLTCGQASFQQSPQPSMSWKKKVFYLFKNVTNAVRLFPSWGLFMISLSLITVIPA